MKVALLQASLAIAMACWTSFDPQPLPYEGGPSSAPAVDDGRVYTFSKSGDLFCLDARDGHVILGK
ncbi:MAG: PQQ-binding-like beta-propeller repeat protein [bacterium]